MSGAVQERYATEAEAVARARELRAEAVRVHGAKAKREPSDPHFHYCVTESVPPREEDRSPGGAFYVERELGAPMVRVWERRVFSTSDPE